ncbi:MAG: hypothetical protein SGI73_10510 [Chloroflexota bacterium]|nr:hypothetical protein [Chloroflexota bacterium]
MTPEEVYKKRDAKTRSHLEGYAPVWIVDQKYVPEEEAVQFNIVFQHTLYGWVNRRYLYDGFNDVLYHKGQTSVDEMRALEIQETEPYVTATVSDVPNAYGG